MRHELKWFIHLRAQRPRVGDEHPAYAPAGAWFPLPLKYLWYHMTEVLFNGNPELWNKERKDRHSPFPRKFYEERMHFCAKFSLVLDASSQ